MTRVGVLALQGGFAAHVDALERAGVTAEEIRAASRLAELDGLVLPGGESTTLLNLMRDQPWFEALRGFHARGGAFLSTCAGTILLARDVSGPKQPSLGLLNVTVRRNAWGRQVDSFEAELDVRGWDEPLRAIFIRAPRITVRGGEVEVLAHLDGEPVLVRQDRILACAFHPELADDSRLHREFVEMVRRSSHRGARAENRLVAAERTEGRLGWLST